MNVPQPRAGITLSTWLHLALGVAMVLPAGAVLIIALVATPWLSPTAQGMFVVTCLACLLFVEALILVAHLVLRTKSKALLLHLVDLCREYAGGDRTVRASVSGNDTFALLAMSLNSLLDTQEIDETPEARGTLGYQPNSMAALQAQVERFMRLIEEVRGDNEQAFAAHSLGILAQTFSSTINTLAHIIEQVQEASLSITTITYEVERAWGQLTTEHNEQLAQLSEQTNASAHLVGLLQNTEQCALRAVDVAGGIEQQGMESKSALYQSLEALYHMQEQLAVTTQCVRSLDRLSSEAAQVMEGLNDLDGHLSLLSTRDAEGGSERVSAHPIVEADLTHLALLAKTLIPRLRELVEQLQGESERASGMVTASVELLMRGTQLVSEVGRQLSGLTLDVSSHAQVLATWSAESRNETQFAQARERAETLLMQQMQQTQEVMQMLGCRLSQIGEANERLLRSVAVASSPELLPKMEEPETEVPLPAATERVVS